MRDCLLSFFSSSDLSATEEFSSSSLSSLLMSDLFDEFVAWPRPPGKPEARCRKSTNTSHSSSQLYICLQVHKNNKKQVKLLLTAEALWCSSRLWGAWSMTRLQQGAAGRKARVVVMVASGLRCRKLACINTQRFSVIVLRYSKMLLNQLQVAWLNKHK